LRNIRACFVTPRSGITGVWSDLYTEMFEHAAEAGVEPVLVHRVAETEKAATIKKDVTEVLVPYKNKTLTVFGPLDYMSWWLDDYLFSVKVASAVKNLDVDVFHLLSSVTGYVFKRKGIGKPILMFGWASAAIGQTNLEFKAKLIVDKFEVPMEKRLVRSIDHVVCVTQAVREFYLKLGVSPSRLSVVPGGVDVDLFRPRDSGETMPRAPGLDGRFTIISVGRIIPIKGFDTVLEAVRALSEEVGKEKVRLLIVGSPSELWVHGEASNPYFAKLKDYVASNDLSAVVTFTGPLPHSALAELLAACDVFVLGSRAEGMGLVILEAMATGLPVVASHVGGIPEIVDANDVGFTFPSGNSGALAMRLLALYKDARLRREIGDRARRVAVEKYAWKQIMCSLHDVYAKVLGEETG
jgi:glycosyltransferase involved in cell wall biosynthesis